MGTGVWGGITGERTAWAFIDVDDPLVAWLAYRGEMVSADGTIPGALSVFHARRMRNAGGSLYNAELELDAARVAVGALLPSRLRGFFAFPDSASAHRASELWNLPAFREDNLVEIELHPRARVSEHDSQFITRRLSQGPSDCVIGIGPWMTQYVSGQTDEQGPWGRMPELIVEGRALLLGTDVRNRAKDRVLDLWPFADSLLELGRVGVQLGTDVGLITAWVDSSGPRRVRYIMREAEYKDPTFLERLRRFIDGGNPIDGDALRSFVEGRARVPDLTTEEFDL